MGPGAQLSCSSLRPQDRDSGALADWPQEYSIMFQLMCTHSLPSFLTNPMRETPFLSPFYRSRNWFRVTEGEIPQTGWPSESLGSVWKICIFELLSRPRKSSFLESKCLHFPRVYQGLLITAEFGKDWLRCYSGPKLVGERIMLFIWIELAPGPLPATEPVVWGGTHAAFGKWSLPEVPGHSESEPKQDLEAKSRLWSNGSSLPWAAFLCTLAPLVVLGTSI